MIDTKKLRYRRIGLRVTVGIAVLLGASVAAFRGVPGTAESVTSGTTAAPSISREGPKMIGPDHRFPVVLSASEWHARLTSWQYHILREQGTEPPFTGKYWNNHRSGIYYSAATGQPLFSSKDKFDSGTGWPSFTKPIDPGAVLLRPDNSHSMHRTEVVDSLSGSHLGHVFNDGPPPTYKRYCIDSAALLFVPTGGTPPAVLRPRR